MSLLAWSVISVVVLVTGYLAYRAWVKLPTELEEQTRELVMVFGTAIELRYPLTEGITDRMVRLGRLIGEHLGLTHDELIRLELAARLRDIGLVAVPYELLNETTPPQWTPAEKATFDRHPEIGAAMLDLVPSLQHLAPAVRCHHTRFDGRDGPTFPKGAALPVESRILAALDHFMLNERLFGQEKARALLQAERGGQFDPAVVDAFFQVLPSQGVVEVAIPVRT